MANRLSGCPDDGGGEWGDGRKAELDFAEFDFHVVAVVLLRGGVAGVAHEDHGVEEAAAAGGHGYLAAGPGAEFVDVVLGLPAEGAHPFADATEGVFVALGGGAGEYRGVRCVIAQDGLELGPRAELGADLGILVVLGEGVAAAIHDAVHLVEPVASGGGDFALAQAEPDREPNSAIHVEVLGGAGGGGEGRNAEFFKGGEGGDDDLVVGGVVFGFIDVAEWGGAPEPGEGVGQGDVVVQVETLEVGIAGEDAPGLAQAAVGSAEDLLAAFFVVGAGGELALAFLPSPDELAGEVREGERVLRAIAFGAGLAEELAEGVDVEQERLGRGTVGAGELGIEGEDLAEGDGDGLAELGFVQALVIPAGDGVADFLGLEPGAALGLDGVGTLEAAEVAAAVEGETEVVGTVAPGGVGRGKFGAAVGPLEEAEFVARLSAGRNGGRGGGGFRCLDGRHRRYGK